MPRFFNYEQKKSSGRHLRSSSNNPLFEALDVVQTENRRYLRIIYYISNNIFKLCFKIIRLVREVKSLRHRVHLLEEQFEVQQETIVEGVQRNWMREAEYERLLVERNRLRARVADLEVQVESRRSSNNNNSRDRRVGFGFFGGRNNM